MRSFQGWQKVFAFTFRRETGTRGHRATTVVISLLLLLLIPLGMFIAEKTSRQDEVVTASPVATVIIADEAGLGDSLRRALEDPTNARYGHVTYGAADSVASAAAQADDATLILFVGRSADAYDIRALLPEGSALTTGDAGDFSQYVNARFGYALFEKSGLSREALAEVNTPTVLDEIAGEDGEQASAPTDPLAGMREVMTYIIPFIVVMLMYFLVLAYGQGVANSAIMEKTSKLMDTFLISIRPAAMMLGKILAMASAAVLQLTVWFASAAGGLMIGRAVVRAVNPSTQMGLIQLMDSFGAASGLFSPAGVVLALLMIIAGFLMYCSLSGVGAALASKPDDLSSTNMMFTLALVVSFLCTTFTGALYGEGGEVLNYIPFTAVLTAPGQLLLGGMTPLEGLASLGCVVVLALLLALLAGRLYTLTSFWKGNPPSLQKAMGMLKKK